MAYVDYNVPFIRILMNQPVLLAVFEGCGKVHVEGPSLPIPVDGIGRSLVQGFSDRSQTTIATTSTKFSFEAKPSTGMNLDSKCEFPQISIKF